MPRCSTSGLGFWLRRQSGFCPGRAWAWLIEVGAGGVDTRTIAPRPAAQRGFVGRGAMGETIFFRKPKRPFIGLQTILQCENAPGR